MVVRGIKLIVAIKKIDLQVMEVEESAISVKIKIIYPFNVREMKIVRDFSNATLLITWLITVQVVQMESMKSKSM